MQKTSLDIIIFLVITTIAVSIMAAFIISIVYRYRKNQATWLKNIETVKSEYEKNLLGARLEIQEETFSHISKEIHDNIGISLTLAKLNLNRLSLDNKLEAEEYIQNSVSLLSDSIAGLKEISKSLNSELIVEQGLLKALEFEIKRIETALPFKINYKITGEPVFLDGKKELLIFRIIQEAFNNIIKHAETKATDLFIHFNETKLHIDINDYGKGFDGNYKQAKRSEGLKNMESRVKIINGTMQLSSITGQGTTLMFTIPYLEI